MSGLRICNVVASFRLDRQMDLSRIYAAYGEISIWEDRVFRRLVLVMRVPDPKLSFLIYETGKVICSGAKTVRDAQSSDQLLVKMLTNRGILVSVAEPAIVHNVVAVADYGRGIDLEALAMSVEGIEYEPEQFPGASLAMRTFDDSSKASFLIFPTGKIVCLGCTNEAEIKQSISSLFEILEAYQSREGV